MNKKIVLGIIVALLVAIVSPVLFIRDSDSVTAEERACAKRDTHTMLDNPIERLFIIKISVDKKEGNTLFTSAYTVAGVKYATVELVCNEGATVTWRRWFGR